MIDSLLTSMQVRSIPATVYEKIFKAIVCNLGGKLENARFLSGDP